MIFQGISELSTLHTQENIVKSKQIVLIFPQEVVEFNEAGHNTLSHQHILLTIQVC